MIAIDVGCATYGGTDSIGYLIEEFDPDVLYGFDPSPGDPIRSLSRTVIQLSKEAAWVYDGHVGFHVAGTGGQVDHGDVLVPCVDLARFILELPDDEIVLKIDAEGAEYVLLPHLVEHDADLRLKLAWIEWHCPRCGNGGGHQESCTVDPVALERLRAQIEGPMRTEMHQWNR